MITKTSLNNPRFAKRIRRAAWIAKLSAIKHNGRSVEYVKNKHGNNCMRIDVFPDGSLAAYAAGQGNKNIASLLVDIVSGI